MVSLLENNKGICSMVERLPLGIQQATSYIVNNEMNVNQYIEYFKKCAKPFSLQNKMTCSIPKQSRQLGKWHCKI